MAIGSNSYGSVAEVEALVPRWTNDGVFDTVARPTLAQVERFIDRVSSIVNTVLAEQGFSIPVINADAKMVLAQFVTLQVADLCNMVNSAGRFFSEKQVSNPWKELFSDANDFLAAHADGLALLGATRTREGLNGLATVDQDESGNAIVPFFDRKQFGNKTTDWDT